VDYSNTRGDLHRPRDQWLSAGRILTFTAIRSQTKKPGQKPGFDFGLPRLSAQPFSTPIALGVFTQRTKCQGGITSERAVLHNDRLWNRSYQVTNQRRVRQHGVTTTQALQAQLRARSDTRRYAPRAPPRIVRQNRCRCNGAGALPRPRAGDQSRPQR
jgi:hypothetical protein